MYNMRNKLIILSFALITCYMSYSQSFNTSNFGNEQELQISVYPNPAQDFIMVQLDDDLRNVKFELNSMIGNKLLIQPEEVGYGKYKIPVKDLSTGYYFLIIKNEEKRFKKASKFLKL